VEKGTTGFIGFIYLTPKNPLSICALLLKMIFGQLFRQLYPATMHAWARRGRGQHNLHIFSCTSPQGVGGGERPREEMVQRSAPSAANGCALPGAHWVRADRRSGTKIPLEVDLSPISSLWGFSHYSTSFVRNALNECALCLVPCATWSAACHGSSTAGHISLFQSSLP
jgi:hypothetical protein